MKAKTLINFLLSLMVLTSLLGLVPPVLAAPQACTPGPHGGFLAADETWCASDNPHIMTGTVIAPAGVAGTGHGRQRRRLEHQFAHPGPS